MLTPYQFASNRPIDGIDLDGKEWMKTEQYDPKTGISNVHFQVKLQVENCSGTYLISENLKSQINSQFSNAIAASNKEGSKFKFSGNIEIEDVTNSNNGLTFGVSLYDRPKPNIIQGFSPEVVNTKVNSFSVAVGEFNPEEPNVVFPIPYSEADLAQTIVHELSHTAGIKHPMQPDGAPDVQLIPNKTTTLPNGSIKVIDYKPGEKASLKNIIKNIMIYSTTPVLGKPVKEYIPNPLDRGNLSFDQTNQIRNQIDKDEGNK
jgi:hypothetical protein